MKENWCKQTNGRVFVLLSHALIPVTSNESDNNDDPLPGIWSLTLIIWLVQTPICRDNIAIRLAGPSDMFGAQNYGSERIKEIIYFNNKFNSY